MIIIVSFLQVVDPVSTAVLPILKVLVYTVCGVVLSYLHVVLYSVYVCTYIHTYSGPIGPVGKL